jgi:hypothetical protein
MRSQRSLVNCPGRLFQQWNKLPVVHEKALTAVRLMSKKKKAGNDPSTKTGRLLKHALEDGLTQRILISSLWRFQAPPLTCQAIFWAADDTMTGALPHNDEESTVRILLRLANSERLLAPFMNPAF